jgi:hypothetical protein
VEDVVRKVRFNIIRGKGKALQKTKVIPFGKVGWKLEAERKLLQSVFKRSPGLWEG